MRYLTFINSLVLIIITGLAFSANAQSTKDRNTIKERRFQRLMHKKNTAIIDVRTMNEYQDGHLPQAKLLDVQQPGFTDSIQTLDKSKTYLLYCRSGKRSQRAIDL